MVDVDVVAAGATAAEGPAALEALGGPVLALGVAAARCQVGGRELGVPLREAAAALQHPLQRPGGVDLAARRLPDPAHDLVAVAQGEVLPERPVAVVGEAAAVEAVQRGAGGADLAVAQVLPVVVDAVGEPLLHPGRGGLQEPPVLV